ncbi:MAG: sulfotransferase [Lachnospiraceae bacterium]|uniref:sulfotransferase family protein n=1 Tax=Clostridium sp. (strain SY8519) TaxID=1042156 RepID=UPI0002171642|nr:sulfotransferase [Clostridium sp. SY8519]MCI1654958.1 sulfotransferase [Lachnospiraceae bacterium]MCI1657320.1 sulfotransferase [Lachnospiraceae bacterium]MCI2195798.1 sulfotransferase [Lachnospiraceae bacterium]BAK46007.1 hypothetical protein CXIVA_00400 [Clostridium sp. SY8519]
MEKKLNLSHNLMGCTLGNWIALLRDNPITRENRPQAAFMTFVISLLTPPALAEKLIYDRRIKATRLKKDPIYIVGFWRSGTTFLQNLLTRDPQFAWFDPVNTVTFNNSILLRPILEKYMNVFLKGARPMDNLEYTTDLPMEEVFAQATISTQAISHMLVFPDGGRGTKYIETAFISEQSSRKKRQWRRAYDYILKKATFVKDGKQLLLKSPENTCRIDALKKCYPAAKFINIFRHPYALIPSTINMFTKEMDNFCLNTPAPREVIEDVSIDLCARVYRKAIHELEEMKPEDHIDIRYEDFCQDPEAYLRKIYQQLQLEGYAEARPYFEDYLDSQKNYQKNHFQLEDRIRRKINDRLDFYFDYYGYQMQQD